MQCSHPAYRDPCVEMTVKCTNEKQTNIVTLFCKRLMDNDTTPNVLPFVNSLMTICKACLGKRQHSVLAHTTTSGDLGSKDYTYTNQEMRDCSRCGGTGLEKSTIGGKVMQIVISAIYSKGKMRKIKSMVKKLKKSISRMSQ